ncbi:MAG: hypothetical protein ACRCZZ_00625 [Phocaeicola sp.]
MITLSIKRQDGVDTDEIFRMSFGYLYIYWSFFVLSATLDCLDKLGGVGMIRGDEAGIAMTAFALGMCAASLLWFTAYVLVFEKTLRKQSKQIARLRVLLKKKG